MSEPSEPVAPGFGRILCPVDFSEFSRHALDHAAAIAHCFGGMVRALHVMPFPLSDPMVGVAMVLTQEDLDRARSQMERFVSDEVGRTIDTHVAQGMPIETIVAEATAWPADLLVMGSHGRSGFERLMLGSVTERVLRKAPCPVLTVPRRAADVVPAGPVAFRRILCATDFSPASARAVAFAESLARQCQAHLTLVHVIEGLSVADLPVFDGMEPMLVDMRQTSLDQLRASARRGLDATEVVCEGKPYRHILTRAAEERADLIVIGVHTGVVERFHLGSTTNHVVREAECPVLTVR